MQRIDWSSRSMDTSRKCEEKKQDQKQSPNAHRIRSYVFFQCFSLSLRLFGHAPSLVPQDYIQQFHLCPVRTRAVRLHRPDKSGILFRPNPVSDPITASETNKFFVEKKKSRKMCADGATLGQSANAKKGENRMCHQELEHPTRTAEGGGGHTPLL